MSTIVEKPPRLTPEDLLNRADERLHELVDGRLEELNGSALSSLVAGELSRRLGNHANPANLGWVFPADAPFRCFPWDPGMVRRPDVAFVRRDRLSPERLIEGFVPVAPDLAIEVVSPNDLASRLARKLRDYRRAGVRLVWVIDPESRTAHVHRPDGTALDLDEEGVLDGEEVLPGFQCRLGDLIPEGVPAPPSESD
jgi:Uma2 family endonuclease